jgi:hypothetical protein
MPGIGVIDTELVDSDELDELEKLDPPPILLFETVVVGLIDKTCCVCCEALANWSDMLGELEILIPPPVLPLLDVMELPDCVVDVPVVLPP